MEIGVKENSRIDTIDIAYMDAIKALDFIVKNIEESQAKEVFVEFLA